MAQPINVGMPQNVDIPPGYTLRVTAINPTSGAQVAGVVVDQVVIEASGDGDLSSGNFAVANPILLGINV